VLSASRAALWHYVLDGRFADALTKVDWILAELDRWGQRATPTDLYLSTRWMRDGVLLQRDEFDAAERESTETYALAVQAPNRTVQSGAASVLAQVHFARAEYEEARQWAERSLTTAEAIGSYAGVHRGVALAFAARVALREPVDITRDVETIEQGISQGGIALLSIHVVVEALLTLGDVNRAEKLARIAVANAAGRLRVLFAAVALGEVATRRGPSQWGEAERNFTHGLGLAELLGMGSARALGLIGRGRLAFARAQTDAASADWRTARELCSAIGLTRYERIATELLEQIEGARRERQSAALEASVAAR
jgi:hypothetical protein